MSISIHPATPGDAATTVQIGMRAFKNDPLSRLTMNLDTATPAQTEEFRVWRTGMSALRMQGPGKHYFKAVDDAAGEAVGFVGVYAPEAYDSEAASRSPFPTPAFINHEAQGEFLKGQKAARERWLGERQDVWCTMPSSRGDSGKAADWGDVDVQSMAVSPDYWGRGIGKKLLKRALEEVDKAGQDIYLEATPAATALYRSCGFEEMEKISLFDGAFVMTAMMRRYHE